MGALLGLVPSCSSAVRTTHSGDAGVDGRAPADVRVAHDGAKRPRDTGSSSDATQQADGGMMSPGDGGGLADAAAEDAVRPDAVTNDAGTHDATDASHGRDGGTPATMAVGLNGAPGWNAAELDIHDCVSYVRLEDPSTVSYEASLGLKVDVLSELGGYSTNGVSAIDAATESQKLVTWWKANCTTATCPVLEVLNEPSGSWFWGSSSGSAANMTAYGNLLKAVHDAFVAAGVERPILLGSYDNQAWAAGWFPIGGTYVDGVVVHPYGGGCGTPVSASALGNRALVTQAHTGTHKPVYVTEVGWPTAVGQPCTGDSLQWSEADQATNITSFVTWADTTGYVNMVMIFGYRDYGTNNWYGVESSAGTKKLAYAALHALATP